MRPFALLLLCTCLAGCTVLNAAGAAASLAISAADSASSVAAGAVKFTGRAVSSAVCPLATDQDKPAPRR